MKIKGITKAGFDVRSDGSIYTSKGVKVADNREEFNQIENRIRVSNIRRNSYFKQHGIDNSSNAYGGKITKLSDLGNSGELVVNAVIKASTKRLKFAEYVKDRDTLFMELYKTAIENSSLSKEEKDAIKKYLKDMKPEEFAKKHRNDELPDINEFDSEAGQVTIGKKEYYRVLTASDEASKQLRNDFISLGVLPDPNPPKKSKK